MDWYSIKFTETFTRMKNVWEKYFETWFELGSRVSIVKQFTIVKNNSQIIIRSTVDINIIQNLRCLMCQVIKITENPYEKNPVKGIFLVKVFSYALSFVWVHLFLKHHHCAVCQCILDNTVGRLKHQSRNNKPTLTNTRWTRMLVSLPLHCYW